MIMKKIYCPKCKKETHIDIAHAVDAEGEVFMCDHCNYLFRFVKK